MIFSKRYLLLAFYKTQNEYFLYLPKYGEWTLGEEEVGYTPKVLRVGKNRFYKRPIVGYSYVVEGTIYQKTFYELLRNQWYKIWGGVFVRVFYNKPSGSSFITGPLNLFMITGDVIIENLEVKESYTSGENPVKFTLRWNKVVRKRPLWLAMALLPSGEFVASCLDIGKFHTTDNFTPRNVEYRTSYPPDGTIYYATYYPGLSYSFAIEDWEILPMPFYTVSDTSEPHAEQDLTATYLLQHNGLDN